MTIEGTGRIVRTERGSDIVLYRSIALSADDAWRYLTDTARTAEWFGAWEGDARLGGTVRIRMKFEENEPAVRARIVACEVPAHLALQISDEYGSWNLEFFIEPEGDDDCLLRFVHHLEPDANVGDFGPGWEYYLDILVAATEGTERPEFDQYYPALSEYYLTQV